MDIAYKYIQVVDKLGLRKVVINNIRKKNALNLVAYAEITDVLNKSSTDSNIKLVAITGAGDYYSSGNDLSAMLESGNDLTAALNKSRAILRNLVRAFFTFPKLLVCVVNGPCIGIAATTAALCDIIYATDTAYFYTPFSKLGLCAEACASYTFPRILGKSKASEMLLLNHKLTASEAVRFNFVSVVVSQSELDSKIWPKIERFAELPHESVLVTKQLMNKFEIAQLDVVLELELTELYRRFESDEFIEALGKFLGRKSKL